MSGQYPASTTCELIDETPVAFVSRGFTLAVMMASPYDLHDFAVGLSRTEGFSSDVLNESQIDLQTRQIGVECILDLSASEVQAAKHRLRSVTSASSCGLCGVRSIALAVPTPPVVSGGDLYISEALITEAMDQLRQLQPLHDRTHAAHAAGFLIPQRGIVCVREDIGRHNALDKLIGALLRCGEDPAKGAVLLTSRVSVEMVQKVAAFGAPALMAVSAPSALAVRVSKLAGITLIANIKRSVNTVYTHHYRVGPDDVPTDSSVLLEAMS